MARENRAMLSVGIVAFLLISVFATVTYLKLSDDVSGSAEVRAKAGEAETVAAATGNESEEYKKHVREFNNTTLEERREDNPSAHPIPLFDKNIDPAQCDANLAAYADCLTIAGVEGESAASLLGALSACNENDTACIARKAQELGCAMNDTACMVDKGILAAGSCAPEDAQCKASKRSFCAEDDLTCIAKRALESGCDLNDTRCLHNAGIIALTACAPEDDKCLETSIKCDPEDITCIAKKARLAGCEIDDTACLVAAGILRKGTCAPGDAQCQSELLRANGVSYCSEKDAACIERRAAEVGCSINDTECLRRMGVIANDACAATDRACQTAKAQGLGNFDCSENDAACIAKRAAAVGCLANDSACLRAKSVIAPTACAPEDMQCRQARVKCSPDDEVCIARRAAEAGCKVTDSACLQAAGILEPGQLSPFDPMSTSSGVGAGKAKCAKGDIACIAQYAQAAGCQLSNTDCLRSAGIIAMSDCAPGDVKCQEAALKKSRLTPRNSIGDAYVEKVQGDVGDRNYRHSYADRLSDKDYMSEMLQVTGQVLPRKPTDGGFVSKAVNESAVKSKSGAEAFAGSVSSGSGSNDTPTTQGPKGVQMAKSGDMAFGVSDLALSSDYQGPVSLTIVQSGTLRELRLLGKMVALEDKVRLELDTCVFPDGVETTCSAVALDTETTYAAVASDVNNHYLYRYGWWGVGTALSAFGRAAALRAKTVTVVEGGTAVEGSEMDEQAEMRVALGYLGEELGETFKERLKRPPTIHVDRNEELGVFFLKPLIKPEVTK